MLVSLIIAYELKIIPQRYFTKVLHFKLLLEVNHKAKNRLCKNKEIYFLLLKVFQVDTQINNTSR